MAKINTRNVKAVVRGDTDSATIGNNRTLSRSPEGVLVGRLHGNVVFSLDTKTKRMTLKTQGYATPTTRQAITEFVESVVELPCKVGFPKGAFTVTVAGETKTTDGDSLTFEDMRFVALALPA